jgi:hypothetical protein
MTLQQWLQAGHVIIRVIMEKIRTEVNVYKLNEKKSLSLMGCPYSLETDYEVCWEYGFPGRDYNTGTMVKWL